MNICFISLGYPNPRSGGLENVTYILIKSLLQKGYHICSIIGEHIHSKGDLQIDCLPILDLNNEIALLKNYITSKQIDILINQCSEQFSFDIVKLFKEINPQGKTIKVIHSDPLALIKGIKDNSLLLLDKRSKIFKEQLLNLIRIFKRESYLKYMYAQWNPFYDKFIVLSNSYIDNLKKFNIPESKILAINNPIPNSIVKSNDNKNKNILFVGRMCAQAKRPDRMISVWSKLYEKFPDWKLFMIGDGPLKEKLENYCKKKEIKNVYFLGQIDPSPYYGNASILCLTSTYEGLPMVLVEALSYGIIPIAFKSFDGINDVIKNNFNGILIKPFKINKYVKSLNKLMSNSFFRKNLTKNILSDKELEHKLSLNNIINKWINLFDTI